MTTVFRNLYIGFSVLILYVPFSYLGALQQKNSPKFERYMNEVTEELEGSGAVFGYIMVAPRIQLTLSIILTISLWIAFILLRLIFKKATFVKVGNILHIVCSVIIIYFIVLVGITIIELISWGFYMLAVQNVLLILFGLFVLGHLMVLRKQYTIQE